MRVDKTSKIVKNNKVTSIIQPSEKPEVPNENRKVAELVVKTRIDSKYKRPEAEQEIKDLKLRRYLFRNRKHQ